MVACAALANSPRIRIVKHIALLAIIPLLIGCPQSLVGWQMEKVQDMPEIYQVGYEAGCNSGYRAGDSYYHEFQKDIAMYEKNETYKVGWDDGFQICKEELDALRPYF